MMKSSHAVKEESKPRSKKRLVRGSPEWCAVEAAKTKEVLDAAKAYTDSRRSLHDAPLAAVLLYGLTHSSDDPLLDLIASIQHDIETLCDASETKKGQRLSISFTTLYQLERRLAVAAELRQREAFPRSRDATDAAISHGAARMGAP